MGNSSRLFQSLCFSKDRPMQMEGYIRSLWKCCSEPVKISVLYCASNEKFKAAYDRLIEMYPEVDFILETDFKQQVRQWINNAPTPFLIFGCDDVVFIDDFDTSVIAEAFQSPDLLGFSLRLGRNVTYSAMTHTVCAKPRFLKTEPCLLWNRHEAGRGWNYPFELDCTIYDRTFLMQLINACDTFIKQPDVPAHLKDWGHPNHFEHLGSTISLQIKAMPNLACFETAKGIVVTVNRVQEACKNFVYDDEQEFDSNQMLELWNNGMIVDIDAYAAIRYKAIHVGDLRLCHREDKNHTISNADSYDFYKTMIDDYCLNLKKSGDTLLQHPELSAFFDNFTAYFHMPGAEVEQPVLIKPFLDGKNDPAVFNQPEGDNSDWISERIAGYDKSSIVWLTPQEGDESFEVKQGVVPQLPHSDKSVQMLVSYGLIEHIGLGRFDDRLDPEGSSKAFAEINRVVAPGGHFVGYFPVNVELFIAFNECRVFSRDHILNEFPDFELVAEQAILPDSGQATNINDLPDYQKCMWCFDLKKKQ